MLQDLFGKEEKKVEYVELIYDLIFVYIIGRNNSLLHNIVDGFIPMETYLTYLVSSLVILQVWYFTVLFINRYGSNHISEYIGLFINMYLLYYMADGTRAAWQSYYAKYCVAWGLILLNLAFQYFLKLRRTGAAEPLLRNHIKLNILILALQAGIVFVSIPVFDASGFPLVPIALIFGFVTMAAFGSALKMLRVDFAHLTERIMLFVVFTFGEMIISIAVYFNGGLSFTSIYFSIMAFLIVVCLFMTYGYFYDHVIDRERCNSGMLYMLVHVFLILALNNLTVSLEFMQEPEVSIMAKNIFLVVSFLAYFIFLFALQAFAKHGRRPTLRFTLLLCFLSLAFVVLMSLFYRSAPASITVTVVYIYAMFACFLARGRQISRSLKS